MKQSIDVDDLGGLTHELVALPKSARLEICIGGEIYSGKVELETEPGCARLHFDEKKKKVAPPKSKGSSKK
jgi:hypothetical protein